MTWRQVKDRTSVLNQDEQAVSQPVRSYPLVPGLRKQDFAVDSHYQLHFTYSSPEADRLRFICLISYSLRSCFDFANSLVTCQNNFPECKICRKSALMYLVARSSIQCISAHFRHISLIATSKNGFIDKNQLASRKTPLHFGCAMWTFKNFVCDYFYYYKN